MNEITICLPIYIDLGAKKKKSTFSLNLNTYRNAHFQILNKAKVLFEELVTPLVAHLPRMRKVEISYALFFGSKRAIDISNVCCIVDKFFCDTLVNSGRLPGDDKEVISKVGYDWGGIDIQNPHVKATLSNIEWVEGEDTPMQITITKDEIREALLEYLGKQIILAGDQSIVLEFDLDQTVTPAEIVADVFIRRNGSVQTGTKLMDRLPTGSNAAGGATAPAATPIPTKRGPGRPPKATIQPEPAPAAPPEEEAGADTAEDDTRQISSGEDRVEKSESAVEEQAAEAGVELQKATSAPSAIFPNAASSAAPAAPTTAPAGKSLFANLTKPNNRAADTNGTAH